MSLLQAGGTDNYGLENALSVLATEETLQVVAGLNYDNTLVDMSNPASIVITYTLLGSIVGTETITQSGSTFNIAKS